MLYATLVSRAFSSARLLAPTPPRGRPLRHRAASVLTMALALLLCTAGPASAQRLLAPPEMFAEEQDDFGFTVENAGDVTGDGVDDVIAAAPSATVDGAEGAGRVFLFDGADGTFLRALVSPSPVPDALFGFSIAGAGDVDGDGRDDVVVGEPVVEGDPEGDVPPTGRAHIFSGRDGALLRTLTAPSSRLPNVLFGFAVGGAGAPNGNSRADVIVGSGFEVFLFDGDGSLLYTLTSPLANLTSAPFTGAAESVGDVDGDGVPDVVVEAVVGTTDEDGNVVKGYLYSGATGTLLHALGGPGVAPGGSRTAFFLLDVIAGLGDVDGDGVPDVAMGSPYDAVGTVNQVGRLYLFSGADGTLLQTVAGPVPNAGLLFPTGSLFGLSVSRTGDYDDDGLDDILVGSPFAAIDEDEDDDTDPVLAGRAFVVSSNPASTAPIIGAFRSPDGDDGGLFAVSVAGAGDVNGDGRLDAVVGAPGEDGDDDGTEQGVAYLFSGANLLPVASATQTVSGDGAVAFGTTGVVIAFSGTAGTSGAVTVERGGPPLETAGIDESTVSAYSFEVRAAQSLTVGSGTELRFEIAVLGGITDPDAVTIYTRPGPGESWTALATTVSDGFMRTTVDGFSEFVFASDTNPLPVELARFTGRPDGGHVLLEWQTAGEVGNAGFDVQHRAEGGRSWATIGVVPGRGTTDAPQAYRFETRALAPGPHEFRLRQVDADGTATVGAPLRVVVPLEAAVALTAPAPNPAAAGAGLTFAVREARATTVALYNTLGQRVATLYRDVPAAGTATPLRIETAGLPAGAYFVRLVSGPHAATQRLLVLQ